MQVHLNWQIKRRLVNVLVIVSQHGRSDIHWMLDLSKHEHVKRDEGNDNTESQKCRKITAVLLKAGQPENIYCVGFEAEEEDDGDLNPRPSSLQKHQHFIVCTKVKEEEKLLSGRLKRNTTLLVFIAFHVYLLNRMH